MFARQDNPLTSNVIRWKLPLDAARGGWIWVRFIVIPGEIEHTIRLWHAEFFKGWRSALGNPLNALEWFPSDKDCILRPGWDCLWPTPAKVGRPQKVGWRSDDKPFDVVAMTLALAEDIAEFSEPWITHHAARGIEAFALYRNDDEGGQGGCLARRALEKQLAWALADTSKAEEALVASISDIIRTLKQDRAYYEGSCLPSLRVLHRSNPVVVEISWPFLQFNQFNGGPIEAQPQAIAHFLNKYAKPLSDWMGHFDFDEYANVVSLPLLLHDAHSKALRLQFMPPGSVEFENLHAAPSLQPSIASNFSLCLPPYL